MPGRKPQPSRVAVVTGGRSGIGEATSHHLAEHGQPDDVAAAVAFLGSDAAGFITGQTLGVNGGQVP